MYQSGIRVGAVLSADEFEVKLLGFGVYEGDFMYGDESVADSPAGHTADLGRYLATNPRIRLDSGEVVWGCECWWGPEADVLAAIKGRKAVNCSIKEVREEVRLTYPTPEPNQ